MAFDQLAACMICWTDMPFDLALHVSSCLHSGLGCSFALYRHWILSSVISETFEVSCNVKGLEKLLLQLLLIVPELCSILSLTQFSFVGDFCKLVVFLEFFSLVGTETSLGSLWRSPDSRLGFELGRELIFSVDYKTPGLGLDQRSTLEISMFSLSNEISSIFCLLGVLESFNMHWKVRFVHVIPFLNGVCDRWNPF